MVPKDTFYDDKTLINMYAWCNSKNLVKWRFRPVITNQLYKFFLTYLSNISIPERYSM